jgi:hypothetical protein
MPGLEQTVHFSTQPVTDQVVERLTSTAARGELRFLTVALRPLRDLGRAQWRCLARRGRGSCEAIAAGRHLPTLVRAIHVPVTPLPGSGLGVLSPQTSPATVLESAENAAPVAPHADRVARGWMADPRPSPDVLPFAPRAGTYGWPVGTQLMCRWRRLADRCSAGVQMLRGG